MADLSNTACSAVRKGHTFVYFFGTRRYGWARTDTVSINQKHFKYYVLTLQGTCVSLTNCRARAAHLCKFAQGLLPLYGNLGLAYLAPRDGKQRGKKTGHNKQNQRLADALAEARCSLQSGHGSPKGNVEVAAALVAFDKFLAEEGFAEAMMRGQAGGGEQGRGGAGGVESNGTGGREQTLSREADFQAASCGDAGGKRKRDAPGAAHGHEQGAGDAAHTQCQGGAAGRAAQDSHVEQRTADETVAPSLPREESATGEGETGAGMTAGYVEAVCPCAHWLGEPGAVGVEQGRRGDVVVKSALPHDTHVTGLALSPCGRQLVSCTRSGVLYVWEKAQDGSEGEVSMAGGEGCGKGSSWRRRARWCDSRQTNEVGLGFRV